MPFYFFPELTSCSKQVRKTGIFPAHLYFRKPVDVYWRSRPTEDEPLGTELHLGSFKLAHIGAAAGHGRVKQVR